MKLSHHFAQKSLLVNTEVRDFNPFSSDRGLTCSQKKPLIIIDPRVEDYHQLIAGVETQATILLLDQSRDGIEQITIALVTDPSDSLHIICHGHRGTLYLGKNPITGDNLFSYQHFLKQWKIREILLYACQVADSPSDTFLQRLHQLTNASIAASQYPVGNAAKGGTWQLETQIGLVNPQAIFSSQVLQEYAGILHSVYLDQFGTFENDVLVGTSNSDDIVALAGDDTIEGLENPDLLSGNAGNDMINGGSGNDIIYGGAEDDTIMGAEDDDIIAGDQGNDHISGNQGRDTLVGGVGNDNIYGGSQADLLFAASLNDYAVEQSITLTLPAEVTGTTATGTLTFIGFTTSASQLDIEGTFSNLSSPLLTSGETDLNGNLPSAIHLDWGQVGFADTPIRNLSVIDNGDGSGNFSGTLFLTPAEISAYLSGDYRVNINTVNYPNGELTAQLNPNQNIRSFLAQLNGEQAGVVSDATAEAILTLNETQTALDYSIKFQGINLIEDPTQRTEPQDLTKLHLHLGEIGATGPHLLNIFGLPSEDDRDLMVDYEQEKLTGKWDDSDASLLEQSNPMSSKFLSANLEVLLSGKSHLKVHTNAYPTGELRGQILPTSNNLFGDGDNDVLVGSYGNDILDGGLGNDTLTGLGGNDIYILSSGNGVDFIHFEDGLDQIQLLDGLTFSDLTVSQGTNTDLAAIDSQNNTLIQVTATGELLAALSLTSAATINTDDFI